MKVAPQALARVPPGETSDWSRDIFPRFLADGVPIAHKTGTFLNSRNDAGIIYLPDGTHLVVITFAVLRRDLLDADRRVATPYIDRVDSAMGLIARDAYDAFAPGEVTKGS